MKIDSYSFGRIVINGSAFCTDVVIYPDRIDASWWRKEGHLLLPEDLTEVLRTMPDVLVIGTGYAGIMRVPEETVEWIENRGIEVKVARTSKAVEMYNNLLSARTVIAALHITC